MPMLVYTYKNYLIGEKRRNRGEIKSSDPVKYMRADQWIKTYNFPNYCLFELTAVPYHFMYHLH